MPPSHGASWPTSKTSNSGAFKRVFNYDVPSATTTSGTCTVTVLGHVDELPEKHVDIDAFVAGLGCNPTELADARAWATGVLGDLGSLAALRRSNNLSQAELASRLGTSQSHVARMEAGGQLMHETMRKLCEVLGVDMNALDRILIRTRRDT